ncbi:MAG: AAA family ATPase [Candidatus Saccharimonadales bacterium]
MITQLVLHPETQHALESYLEKPTQAILLSGGVGQGKTLLARELAAQLLHVSNEDLPHHPYCRIVQPEAAIIGVNTVRLLQQFVSLTVPNNDEVKRVVVLQDADAMTREAQNAFLKLLEEPPAGTFYLLTSSKPMRLLPTVRSRLQTSMVRTPLVTDIHAYFEKQGYASQEITKANLLAPNNIARMNALLAGTDEDSMAQAVQLAKEALRSETFTRLTMIDAALKDKVVARQFVDALVLITTASIQQAAISDKSTSLKKWHEVLQASLVAEAALRKSGNTKLVLTELMLAL